MSSLSPEGFFFILSTQPYRVRRIYWKITSCASLYPTRRNKSPSSALFIHNNTLQTSFSHWSDYCGQQTALTVVPLSHIPAESSCIPPGSSVPCHSLARGGRPWHSQSMRLAGQVSRSTMCNVYPVSITVSHRTTTRMQETILQPLLMTIILDIKN